MAPKLMEAAVKFVQRRSHLVNEVMTGRDALGGKVIGKICLAVGMGLLSVGCMERENFMKTNYAKIFKGLWQ